MAGLLRRVLGGGLATDGRPDWPRASGGARVVERIVLAARTPLGMRFLPTDDLDGVGSLRDLEVLGPRHLRPGDATAPEPTPAHRMSELTVLRHGSLEHRDALGNRGTVQGPAARLVSAGAGILTEVGLHPDVRRDGGEVEVTTVRWVQAVAVTPTVRIVDALPTWVQGRSLVTPLLGGVAPLPSAEGNVVLRVEVAPGGAVDLDAPDGQDVVVAVLSGTALLGEELTPVDAGSLAVLGALGERLEVHTRLEDRDATSILVLSSPTIADTPPLVRRGLLVADDADGLAALAQAVDAGAFGRLPTG